MLDLPEDTYLSHASKGRLRIKIPSKKRDEAFFADLQKALATLPGLDKIETNSLSGSLLIVHTQLPDELASWVKNLAGLSRQKTKAGKPNSIYQMVSGTFQQVNKKVQGFTKGELDVPTLSFMALLAVGIYQISRKNFAAPAWYTAFWYALNIFLKTRGKNGQETELV
jgi:hypothetical protein